LHLKPSIAKALFLKQRPSSVFAGQAIGRTGSTPNFSGSVRFALEAFYCAIYYLLLTSLSKLFSMYIARQVLHTGNDNRENQQYILQKLVNITNISLINNCLDHFHCHNTLQCAPDKLDVDN